MCASPPPKLHCRRVGRGPDLVLLHGWGLHAGIWEPLLGPLSERFRLHLFDLPGHGHSAAVPASSLDEACVALAQAAPERADWLGWSLGGTVALEFAARWPRRVGHLALVASNPRFIKAGDWPDAMSPDVLEEFVRALEEDHDGTLQRFLALIARGAPNNGVLRALREALRKAPPPTPEGLRWGLDVLRTADLRWRFGQLDVPVLLLAGARDTLVPVAALRALVQTYPRVRLREFPQAGHAPFISHPQVFVDALAEFVA